MSIRERSGQKRKVMDPLPQTEQPEAITMKKCCRLREWVRQKLALVLENKGELAEAIEKAMLDRFPFDQGAVDACKRNKRGYQAKARSLLSNLKHNQVLVADLMAGSRTAEDLVCMSPADMASVTDQDDGDDDTYSKLRRNLQEVRARGAASKYVVLLCTGSYCPVHLQHLKIFEIAKASMERDPSLAVVAGFMSPSHDQYVSAKLVGYAIPSAERLAMVRDATRDHPFVGAHPWEANQRRFCDFPEVSRTVQEQVRREFGDEVKVYYVCGTDHMQKFGLQNGMHGGVGVVGVQRQGTASPELPPSAAERGVILVTSSAGGSDASSTEVRERLKTHGVNAKLDDLLHPAVANRMRAQW
jgi:nicotinic acid mononucleotide adenylyltransferase